MGVRSAKAYERVMALLRRRLPVHWTKSMSAKAFGRKCPGYALAVTEVGEARRLVADNPMATFKQWAREFTRRSGGRSLAGAAEWLRPDLPGWKAYVRLAQTPRVWRELHEWLRHRLRATQLKHRKRGTARYREPEALGVSGADAHRVAADERRW